MTQNYQNFPQSNKKALYHATYTDVDQEKWLVRVIEDDPSKDYLLLEFPIGQIILYSWGLRKEVQKLEL